MTTIILTIIGILLAAAAALMVIFYGGDAFNSGTIGAQANQIQNAGTNVVSAVQMYKAERAASPAVVNPTNPLAELTATAGRPNGAFLDELPALGADQTGTLVRSGTRDLYVVSGTGITEQICARINTNLRVTAPAAVANAAAAQTAAAGGAGPKMACYPLTPGGGVFIARA